MLVFFTNLGLMEFQVRYLASFLFFSVTDGFEWFWMGSLHKNIQLTLGPILFLLYISDPPDDVICDSFIYADDTTLCSNCDQALTCGNNLNLLLNLNLIYETLWTGAGSGLLISMLEKFNWLCLTGLITLVLSIDVKMDGSVFEEKSSFKMLGLTFSSKLDCSSYIISIAKTTSKKIGALIRSVKLLSEVALYLYKSTIRPRMEYCCHVWTGAPSCYLELLDKLQKRICGTVGPSLAASLEPLTHRRNVASLSLL